MQSKNNILISAALIVIASLVGYYFGATQIIPAPKFIKIEKDISTNQLTVDKLAEFERYKKAVETMFPPVPEEIFAIGGTVKDIKDDSITIEMPPLIERILPGEEPKIEEFKMEERKIIIGENTKLIKITPLSPLVTEPEKEMFVRQEELFKLSDLKVGDYINVESSENIKNKKEFIATKIVFYPAIAPEEIIPIK